MPKRTVFFDVDTQYDFLFPAGSLYVLGAEMLLPNLASLTSFAAANNHAVISTADAHRENDLEFQTWPPHCVAGTLGQQKVTVTRLSPAITLSSEPGSLQKQSTQLAGAAQVIVEKQTLDAFTNPNLKPLLDHLQGDCYVVYGVVTELCVEKALAGLVKLGKRTVLVTDAIQSLGEAGQGVIDQYQQAGVELRKTSQVISSSF
jgi:nicotinamidase/pyrazinamidase